MNRFDCCIFTLTFDPTIYYFAFWGEGLVFLQGLTLTTIIIKMAEVESESAESVQDKELFISYGREPELSSQAGPGELFVWLDMKP